MKRHGLRAAGFALGLTAFALNVAAFLLLGMATEQIKAPDWWDMDAFELPEEVTL